MKQGSESARKFIDRFQAIKTKLDTACPNQMSEKLYLSFFKQALRNEYRREIKRLSPKTLNDAMKIAK